MKNLQYLILTWIIWIFLTGHSTAQVAKRMSKSFSNPTVPATLIVEGYQGNIYVEGYKGKEVSVTAYNAEYAPNLALAQSRLIDRKVFYLEEKNNQMTLRAALPEERGPDKMNLLIRVPEKTSLQVSLQKEGDVETQSTSRAVEVNIPQGKVRLDDLYGWAVVNTIEGDIYASFKNVIANKPMSFITLNGNIDLTFPKDLQAEFRMKSTSGNINNAFGSPIIEGRIQARGDEALLPNEYKDSIERLPNLEDKEELSEVVVKSSERANKRRAKLSTRSRSKELDDAPTNVQTEKPLYVPPPPPASQNESRTIRTYQAASSYQTKANGGKTVFLIWAREGIINIQKGKKGSSKKK